MGRARRATDEPRQAHPCDARRPTRQSATRDGENPISGSGSSATCDARRLRDPPKLLDMVKVVVDEGLEHLVVGQVELCRVEEVESDLVALVVEEL